MEYQLPRSQTTDITWSLDPGHAEELLRVLGTFLELIESDTEEEDDGDVALLEVWVDQLEGLIMQRKRWEAQVQPGLVGLS